MAKIVRKFVGKIFGKANKIFRNIKEIKRIVARNVFLRRKILSDPYLAKIISVVPKNHEIKKLFSIRPNLSEEELSKSEKILPLLEFAASNKLLSKLVLESTEEFKKIDELMDYLIKSKAINEKNIEKVTKILVERPVQFANLIEHIRRNYKQDNAKALASAFVKALKNIGIKNVVEKIRTNLKKIDNESYKQSVAGVIASSEIPIFFSLFPETIFLLNRQDFEELLEIFNIHGVKKNFREKLKEFLMKEYRLKDIEKAEKMLKRIESKTSERIRKFYLSVL